MAERVAERVAGGTAEAREAARALAAVARAGAATVAAGARAAREEVTAAMVVMAAAMAAMAVAAAMVVATVAVATVDRAGDVGGGESDDCSPLPRSPLPSSSAVALHTLSAADHLLDGAGLIQTPMENAPVPTGRAAARPSLEKRQVWL